ncbi:MAG: bifunctional metallophosphatase/5'-nucleotidase [Chitinophagaceae bacterium]
MPNQPNHRNEGYFLGAIFKGFVIAVLFLLLVFLSIFLFTFVAGRTLIEDLTHLPLFLGIPVAAIMSFFAIYVFTRFTDSSPYHDEKMLQPADLYKLRQKNLFILILLWLLGFIFIILSIYLLWPLTQEKNKKRDDSQIDINFLQINDVYEISSLDHGKIGGMARVAAVRKELYAHNKNTYALLAGDFLSPSAIGTLFDSATNKGVAGMQMLETLNTVGLNLVTFGNHEFDIKPDQLADAMNKSTFDWISSNVKYNDSAATVKRFSKIINGSEELVPTSRVISFKDDDGTEVHIGVIGLTIETKGNKRTETYEEYLQAAGNALNELKGRCDFIIAITHLDIGSDKMLAHRFPEIKLIIGGHEHINSYNKVGNTIIAKADANAKTVYIHSLHFNSKTKELDIQSKLMVINNALKEDPDTRKIVDGWNSKAHELLLKQGFQPCEILDSVAEPLDGKESSVRAMQTNLGTLVCRSMMECVSTPVDCSFINSGSIRIDDVLNGYISQYDIFRVFPFENSLVVKLIPGYIIDSVLRTNMLRIQNGSFIQYAGVIEANNNYYIKGELLAKNSRTFRVVTNNYVATAKQGRLTFLGNEKRFPRDTNARLSIKINDMRAAFIAYLKKHTSKTWAINDRKVPCY